VKAVIKFEASEAERKEKRGEERGREARERMQNPKSSGDVQILQNRSGSAGGQHQ